jgi:RNA polymerase sigma-70 factor (ECF subfamily)
VHAVLSSSPEREVRLLKLGTPEPGPEPRPRADALEQGEQAVVPVAVPSFAEVFKTYSGFVWRVLLRLGVAESDVDDVAQEVFLGVHRNLQGFEGRCALRTWIYGICHRRAIDYRRRAMTRPELATDEPPEIGTDAEQEDGLDLGLARAKLNQLLESLDEEKRSVFVLFEVEGIPMEEVAEIVGCPLQTAYSRLYAARKKVDALAQRMRAQRRSP